LNQVRLSQSHNHDTGKLSHFEAVTFHGIRMQEVLGKCPIRTTGVCCKDCFKYLDMDGSLTD